MDDGMERYRYWMTYQMTVVKPYNLEKPKENLPKSLNHFLAIRLCIFRAMNGLDHTKLLWERHPMMIKHHKDVGWSDQALDGWKLTYYHVF